MILLTRVWRWLVTIVGVFVLTSIIAAQDHPKITLALPPGVTSETVQMEYFLSGPFGGYGEVVRAEEGKTSYEIEPFVNNHPAKEIKIIAYLPGCEVAALDLAFSGAPIEDRLECKPLGSVPLDGQVPASLADGDNREIEVIYEATWSHRFYGIADGPVTTIHLRTAHPDGAGNFELLIPDLYQQARMRDGELDFILRETKTKNIIAFLKPADAPSDSPLWVKVQASYPIIRLIPQEEQQAKPQPKRGLSSRTSKRSLYRAPIREALLHSYRDTKCARMTPTWMFKPGSNGASGCNSITHRTLSSG